MRMEEQHVAPTVARPLNSVRFPSNVGAPSAPSPRLIRGPRESPFHKSSLSSRRTVSLQSIREPMGWQRCASAALSQGIAWMVVFRLSQTSRHQPFSKSVRSGPTFALSFEGALFQVCSGFGEKVVCLCPASAHRSFRYKFNASLCASTQLSNMALNSARGARPQNESINSGRRR